LKYSKEKFRWGAATPGYIKDLHFMVRNSKNGKILASIIGCPKKMVLCGQNINKMCEVNFLAVHQSLRDKRMA
jgi:glycylpeptide N-tetradecanoyltransferase